MIKRLEGLKKGDKVYVVPNDTRHQPYWTEVLSVGPKKIRVGGSPDLREFDVEDGQSIKWLGWYLYKSPESLNEEKEFIKLRHQVKNLFSAMIDKLTFSEESVAKLKRLKKRYIKYDDELPF